MLTYDGSWIHGRFDGEGSLEVHLFRYQGMFKQGLRHGEGRMENKLDGSLYLGSWWRDIKVGCGLFVWPTGDLALHSHDARTDALLQSQAVTVTSVRRLTLKFHPLAQLLLKYQGDWDVSPT